MCSVELNSALGHQSLVFKPLQHAFYGMLRVIVTLKDESSSTSRRCYTGSGVFNLLIFLYIAPMAFPYVFMSFPALAAVKHPFSMMLDHHQASPPGLFSWCYVPRLAHAKHLAQRRDPNVRFRSYQTVESSSERSKKSFTRIWSNTSCDVTGVCLNEFLRTLQAQWKKEEMEGFGIAKLNPRRCGGTEAASARKKTS